MFAQCLFFLNAQPRVLLSRTQLWQEADTAGRTRALFNPYCRWTRKQTEGVIDCWFEEASVSDRSSCWQLEGGMQMTERTGVGLKRRKEGAQPALFVLARTQAFITPPEIQSKALFTHSTYGIRASCKSFFVFLSLTRCLIYTKSIEILALMDRFCFMEKKEGYAGALYTTFLSVSLHLLSSFVFPLL